MPNLRSAVIRLAHENPDLRAHLLPILNGRESKTATPYMTGAQLTKCVLALVETTKMKVTEWRDDGIWQGNQCARGKVEVPVSIQALVGDVTVQCQVTRDGNSATVYAVYQPINISGDLATVILGYISLDEEGTAEWRTAPGSKFKGHGAFFWEG